MAGTPPYYDNVQYPAQGGLRVPNEVFGTAGAGKPSGTFDIDLEVDLTPGALTSLTLLPWQTAGSYFTVGTASGGAVTVNFPAAMPGNTFTVFNNSGQNVTFKVTGQTGVLVATGKRAILVSGAVDIARVTADT